MRSNDYGPDPLDLPLKLWLARLAHGISPSALSLAYSDWLAHAVASPSHQAALAGSALRKSIAWQNYAQRVWGADCSPCVAPAGNDKRFDPPEWGKPPFNILAQGFLSQQQWWQEAMTGVSGVSRHHEDVAAFATRQWLDIWSPSNFVDTNPQVLEETMRRGGANLVEGAANWARDAVAVMTDGPPRGVEAFVPGEGTALTPGKVVFRNSLIELIQYEPATPTVWAEPVLVVPSWIMKFYILDLTPGDSLVEHLVQQGHTVFMVSWRNPGSADRNLGMDDYLQLGVLEAIDAVQRIVPRMPVHAMGYCLGGTLLAIAAALLGADKANPLASVTLLAAQTDFHEPGELGLFIDESQIAFLEGLMAEHGYLDGRQMAGAFQLINSKDLVWSKLVHEYLMGAQSPMTSMRAWNADATRLPARMHSEYLRGLFLHNDLAEGRYKALGQTVRLDAIDVPMFVAATQRDHVAPWKSVYKVHGLVHSPVTMALASGGHNMGIVSPPSGPMADAAAGYYLSSHAPMQAPADADDWLKGARPERGSWWPAWTQWLAQHSTRRVKPRPVKGLVQGGSPMLAPGSYVLQK